MHIPDGYLSPSTCAVLYGLAATGWYAALKRIKRAFSMRTIPLIAVFASFSFLVMMFNLPLPGGTTGHAVGVTIAAVVLGPWGSILAVSIALAIQALLFGDGGITTFGANAFNMAVVGSFVAYGTYRLISGSSEVISRQRVIAAAIAGYACVNAAALITAVEFGIQPALFHDQQGTPLYAPYPLHIAIPAMMIGHLTIAGLAEGTISAGIVSYLQHADVALLRGPQTPSHFEERATVAFTNPTRYWLVIVSLLLLTPLGILAAGTAWGEWSTEEMSNTYSRDQIAEASKGAPLPASPPAGIRKLSTVWTAPFPDYAPRFIKSQSFGYLMSAMFGVGVLAGLTLISKSIVLRRRPQGRRP